MLTYFKRHWLFLLPLAVFACYYTFQNIIGYYRYPAGIIGTMVIALCLSVLSYVLSYRFVSVKFFDSVSAWIPKFDYKKYVSRLIVFFFFLIVFWSVLAAKKVPLFESLLGASASELVEYRSLFMRGAAGSGQLINYLYAIFLQALMPLAVAYFIVVRSAWRFFALGIFIFGASLSLSKGIFLCVAAPLFAIYMMERRWVSAACTVAGFFLSVALMYVLASGLLGAFLHKVESRFNVESGLAAPAGKDDGSNLHSSKPSLLKEDVNERWNNQVPLKAEREEELPEAQVELQSDVPDSYNLFSQRTQFLLIVNRIVWIPYVTALDWFRYQSVKMDGEYLLGKSIRPIAYVTGSERVYLEKEVAELQWGGPSGATSNAVFFSDAWVNWGPLGVVLYSCLLALSIKLIITSRSKSLIAASAFPIWVACFSALPPVYLSAGLGFLVILALIYRGSDDVGV